MSIILVFIATICFPFTIFSQELTGKQIIEKANAVVNPESSRAESKMSIITTSGKKRTFEITSYSKNRGEKNLIRYNSPVRVKGQATLMLNNADDIWAYFPITRRVRKLATHAKRQKMQGSDFSYEDMGSGDSFIKDYTSRKLKDEKKEGYDCYKIELIKNKGSNVSYSRLIMWVIKENFVPIVIDYYDDKEPDLLIKELIQSDIKVIDNIPTAMKMVMHNKLDNTQTSMEFISVEYNIDLDDWMFTEKGLIR